MNISGCLQTEGGDRDQLLPGPGEAVQAPSVPPQGTEVEEGGMDCPVQHSHLETAGRGN